MRVIRESPPQTSAKTRNGHCPFRARKRRFMPPTVGTRIACPFPVHIDADRADFRFFTYGSE